MLVWLAAVLVLSHQGGEAPSAAQAQEAMPPEEPIAPSLLSPINRAQLQSLGPIGLHWTVPAGARQYQLRVTPLSGDGPGLDVVVSDPALVNLGTYALQPPLAGEGNYFLLPGMTYLWHVRTSNDASAAAQDDDESWGPWTLSRWFRTPAPTSTTISLVDPDLDTTVADRTPVLHWSDTAPGIFLYEVQLSADREFREGEDATPVYWNVVHGGASDPLNSWQAPTLDEGQRYYWRVRPRVQGDGTPVEWTDVSAFRTPDPPPPPPQAAVAAPAAARSPAAAPAGGGAAHAPVYPAAPSSSLEGSAVLLNQIRQANGMGPLSPDGRITAAAQSHSADMAARNAMSHTGSNGSSPAGRLSAAGVAWRTYGEVVAAGQSSAQAAVNGWMNSQPHRQVILLPGLTHAGVGYAVSAAGRTYWTVDFAAQ